jgi:hypothetical protein
MPELQEFPLTTTSGLTGSVFRRARFLDRTDVNRIRLSDGTEFEVPSNAVRVQPDGSFVYDDSAAPRETSAPRDVAGPRDSGGRENAAPRDAAPDIRAAPPEKPVARRANGEYTLDDALFSDDVTVERIPVNRLLDAPAETRQEGETTVIPVMEEVITIQKRLFLREEVRITRRRTEVREPRKILMDGAQTKILGADGREIPS